MPLNVRAEENLKFGISTFDSPAGQYPQQQFGADNALTSEVARFGTEPAIGKQNFQKHAILIEAPRRPHEAAVAEDTVAPQVLAVHDHDARVFLITGACLTEHHPKITKKAGHDGDRRRANAPPKTHRSRPELPRKLQDHDYTTMTGSRRPSGGGLRQSTRTRAINGYMHAQECLVADGNCDDCFDYQSHS